MSMMHARQGARPGPPARSGRPSARRTTWKHAFIGYLEDAAAQSRRRAAQVAADRRPSRRRKRRPASAEPPAHAEAAPTRFSLARVWAFARREAIELRHDTVRLTFAVLGPILLMIVFGYGISLDVESSDFRHAGLRQDHRPAGPMPIPSAAPIYYDENEPIPSYEELDRRLRNGELRFAIEIPPGFQQDLIRGRQPTVSGLFRCGGAVPRRDRAQLCRKATHRIRAAAPAGQGPAAAHPAGHRSNTRALYNQSFESIYAMVPGNVMLLLMLIPSMLTALSVVREKELGSIANFYAAPATKAEFLLGKQLPYVAIALIQFAPSSCSPSSCSTCPSRAASLTLVLGGVIYVLASTGFGLLISVFAATQTAAIFAAAIITILPATQFSGMFVPLSSLTGGAGSRRRSSPAPTSSRSASAPSPRRWDWRPCGPTSSRSRSSRRSTSPCPSPCCKKQEA